MSTPAPAKNAEQEKKPEEKKPEQKSWEDQSKDRIEAWREELGTLKEKNDEAALKKDHAAMKNYDAALKFLKAAIDAQLALSDLRVKGRQAGHPKLVIWLPTGLAFLGSILGAALATLVKKWFGG